jgi:hypothetical protein
VDRGGILSYDIAIILLDYTLLTPVCKYSIDKERFAVLIIIICETGKQTLRVLTELVFKCSCFNNRFFERKSIVL